MNRKACSSFTSWLRLSEAFHRHAATVSARTAQSGRSFLPAFNNTNLFSNNATSLWQNILTLLWHHSDHIHMLNNSLQGPAEEQNSTCAKISLPLRMPFFFRSARMSSWILRAASFFLLCHSANTCQNMLSSVVVAVW